MKDIRVVGTIDMTPTWEAILPIYITLLRENRSSEGIAAAISELTRMAKIADTYIAEQKK